MVRAEIVHPLHDIQLRIIQACIDQNIESEFHAFIVEDVCRIVNDGFRYPSQAHLQRGRRGRETLRIPDDYSIRIARQLGVEPCVPY